MNASYNPCPAVLTGYPTWDFLGYAPKTWTINPDITLNSANVHLTGLQSGMPCRGHCFVPWVNMQIGTQADGGVINTNAVWSALISGAFTLNGVDTSVAVRYNSSVGIESIFLDYLFKLNIL